MTTETALRALLESIDEESGTIDVSPSPGCVECTHGVTPKSHDTGLCLVHQAREALASPPVQPGRVAYMPLEEGEIIDANAIRFGNAYEGGRQIQQSQCEGMKYDEYRHGLLFRPITIPAETRQAPSGWIALSDRKPTRQDAEPKTGWVIWGNSACVDGDIWNLVSHEFTHWMPCPLPPLKPTPPVPAAHERLFRLSLPETAILADGEIKTMVAGLYPGNECFRWIDATLTPVASVSASQAFAEWVKTQPGRDTIGAQLWRAWKAASNQSPPPPEPRDERAECLWKDADNFHSALFPGCGDQSSESMWGKELFQLCSMKFCPDCGKAVRYEQGGAA